MTLKPIFAGLLLVMSLKAMAQKSLYRKELFVSGNDSIAYRLLFPANYRPAKKYPLLLFLHGAGERGRDNELQLKRVGLLIDSLKHRQFPCFVLVPQCPKQDAWVNFPAFPASLAATAAPTTATRLTLALVHDLLTRLPLDERRIYLTGFSMGGEGTFDFLAREPTLFAAAAPVCAVADTSQAKRLVNIPVWAFHGDADQVNDVTYSRLMISALKKAGGTPRYTEYEGVQHNAWVNAYAEPALLPWLFAQKRTVARRKRAAIR